MAGPASRVKRKLEGRGRGKSRASLLEDALRDWRSGRAYFERMHALDRVRSRLIHESAAMEGVH